MDNMTAKSCAKIISVSKATKEDLIRQGYPKQKIEVVYNGIKVEERKSRIDERAVRESLGVPEDARMIMHIGRLCPDKGQQDVLEVAGEIIKEFPASYFIFVGKDIAHAGLFEKRLIEKTRDYGLERNIRFLSLRNDIADLLSLSECLVLPSRLEGFPVVILEAMTAKKPVVAYRSDGIIEAIVDRQTGYLVNPGDLKGLKEGILRILRNPENAKILGENGFARVKEKFTLENQTDRILEIYKEILR
jgi:glycosyltransferase involved in cell wall biosynthesis